MLNAALDAEVAHVSPKAARHLTSFGGTLELVDRIAQREGESRCSFASSLNKALLHHQRACGARPIWDVDGEASALPKVV